jgi:hypothetical protein
MNAVRRISPGRVTADFFTASYRFSASITVYTRRLIDVLSDETTDYLDMADVYISRINNPGDIVATYQTGTLVKDEINFIMLPTETEGTSRERHYVTGHNLPIFIAIPSFEIHGKIWWGSKALLAERILTSNLEQFLPVLEVTASNSLFSKVTFQSPMALINKTKIQFVCAGHAS